MNASHSFLLGAALTTVLLAVGGVSLQTDQRAVAQDAPTAATAAIGVFDDDDANHEEDLDEAFEREVFFDREQIQGPFAEMHQLMDFVEHLAETAANERHIAVLAVLSVEELYDDRAKAAEFLEDVLADVDDEVVRRVIRMQLARMYAETEQPREKAEQLRALITGKKP